MAYVIPETVLILLIEVTYVVVSLVISISCCCNICYKDSCCCCCVNKCLHSILTITKTLERKPDKTTVFNDFPVEESDYSVIYYLLWYITWLIFGAAMVFLDAFLIEVTNSCDPSASKANCFLNTELFNFSALYDEPIDCNNLIDLPDNTTFICYRYTLDLGGAIGIAGGFFTTGMMFMTLITVCYKKEKPSDCCDEDEDCCCNEYCCCNKDNCCNIVKMIHMIVGALLSFIALLVVVAVPTLQQIWTEGSPIIFFKFIHILSSLLLAHSIIACVLIFRQLKGEKPQDIGYLQLKSGVENV